MTEHLTEEEIRYLNHRSLETSGEHAERVTIQPDDIRFAIRFASDTKRTDIYWQAAA